MITCAHLPGSSLVNDCCPSVTTNSALFHSNKSILTGWQMYRLILSTTGCYFILSLFNSVKIKSYKTFKIIGRMYKKYTHLPYMLDCRNGLPGAHNEGLTEYRGIIQHEVDRKNPKQAKFHDILSCESPSELCSTQKPAILNDISTFFNSIHL